MPSPLSERAAGRWSGLLSSFGLDSRFLTNRQGPCPLCGGKTRFRYDDREGRGTWICNHCGAGDGADLAMRVSGLPFRDVAQRIEEMLGTVELKPLPAERSEKDIRAALNRLWRTSEPVQDDDPVGRYLCGRIGPLKVPPCLRMARRIVYRDTPSSWHPAMIAMVTASNGLPAILHRTYLTEDGCKATVEFPRRLMPGTVPDGAAIRLFEPGPVMGIAEGIETALSAASLFGVPVWAAVSDTMLAKWEPPPGTREVIVFGDSDPGFAGQAAAYALARRLKHADRSVRVELPPAIGSDWNDVLCGRVGSAATAGRIASSSTTGLQTERN